MALLNGMAAAVTKKFGAESVGFLNDAKLYSQVKDYVSLCFGVDFAMHLDGIPCGRVTTIVGAEASAKTTLALCAVANTQRRGGIACYIDTEYALDKKRAVVLGVDASELMLFQPETTEDAIGVIKELIAKAREHKEATGEDPLITIVLDSAAGAPTKGEMAAGLGAEGQKAGGHAGLYSQAMRQIVRGIAATRIALIIINQEKEKLSFTGFARGDSTKTMIAANPLNFHSSMILTTHRIQIIKDSKKVPKGIVTRVRVKKNKNAAPFSEADVTIWFDERGVDDNMSILAMAVAINIIEKDRAYYVYECDDGDIRKFQQGGFAKLLEELPEIMRKINEFKSSLAAIDAAAEEEDDDEAEDADEDEE